MRQTFITILILASLQIFAQSTWNKVKWYDTSYITVKLADTTMDKKVAIIEIGQKAIIYVSETIIRQNAVNELTDFNRKELSKIIDVLDSSFKIIDSVSIDLYLIDLDYLVSKQLKDGNVRVYYKKTKSFVPTISHRLEKYGMYAIRFFYLPDGRAFFSNMEYSGIIENNKYSSDPTELRMLGIKLANLRENNAPLSTFGR